MVEIEDIRMRKNFEENTKLVVEGKMIEGRPGIAARLFIPPDRYEYLGLLPLPEKSLSEKELNNFLEEIKRRAREALKRNKLELFLLQKGFKKE